MNTIREFEITQEMIERAIPLDPERCIIALAIAAHLPDGYSVTVGTSIAYFGKGLDIIGIIELSPEAYLIRIAFDMGRKITLQKFTLEGDWSFLE